MFVFLGPMGSNVSSPISPESFQLALLLLNDTAYYPFPMEFLCNSPSESASTSVDYLEMSKIDACLLGNFLVTIVFRMNKIALESAAELNSTQG